ncbi:hypothetical protein GGR54DRAFT_266730 [Hypoxylon sp. NC1633]|nr:hypothetical protein GGR54DRAFT_266730 [Hypoxylon sp. NC1633]
MENEAVLADQADPRPDEYALENGLSVDSQADLSLLFAHFQRQSSQLFPANESDGLENDISLPQLQIPYLIPKTEQLGIVKESLELLSYVASLGRSEANRAVRPPIPPDFSKLKLELPLLRSDPDYDCRKLARSVCKWRKADIDLANVPSEPLNAGNDETFEFPEAAHRHLRELTKSIEEERIDIPKGTLVYLSRALKDEWTQAKQNKFIDEQFHRKPLRDLAITPPLSPVSYDDSHFAPDEEVCQIPILSDPSTLLDADLSKAEADLLRQDDCNNIDTPSPLEFDTPAISPSAEVPLLEPGRLNLNSVKIEGPLTPLNSSSSPSLGVERGAFHLTRNMDIDEALDKDEGNLFDAKVERETRSTFGDDILTVLGEKAQSVMKGVEQEQLQTADAIARVEIPVMDFSIPKPDWQQVPPDAASQFSWIENDCETFNVPSWPKDYRAEKQLRWSPFQSQKNHVSLNESFEDDEQVRVFLDPLGLIVSTSADYVWKQPGLTILRETEEDEERLDPPQTYIENTDLDSLVRKRRAELDIVATEPRSSSDPGSPIELIQIPGTTASESYPLPPSNHEKLPNLLLDSNDPSATSKLLSNWVNFHTSKRQKHTKSSFFPVSTRSNSQAKAKTASRSAADSQPEASSASKLDLDQRPVVAAPCPILPTASTPTKIIKALTLERAVFSRLDKFYPNVEIIERDFDRWNSLAWGRNSVFRSPIVSPLAAEADIIVSPATGIVVTTLLKAMQKPPPGQKGLSAIRDRIRSVALRYERLIVLVSERNRVDETMRDLTPAECSGYAEFAGFVTGLKTDAQAYYVGGGDDTLTKWLVSFAMRYAPEAAKVQDILIQEETLWELFMRRAGVNAYAAQAILGQLKPPDDVPETEANQYGLPAFVRMTPIERIQRFGTLMGGERVLGRVNEVLGTRWG